MSKKKTSKTNADQPAVIPMDTAKAAKTKTPKKAKAKTEKPAQPKKLSALDAAAKPRRGRGRCRGVRPRVPARRARLGACSTRSPALRRRALERAVPSATAPLP